MKNTKYRVDLENFTVPKIYKKGQITEGIVLMTNDQEMLVDLGSRSEGVVKGRELKLYGTKVEKKLGEKVLVYVVNPENPEGQIELSIRKTGEHRKWFELQEAKEKNTTIEVKVIEANSGGVIVQMASGLRGFVPTSQLRNDRVFKNIVFSSKEDAKKKQQENLSKLIDIKLEVKVEEIDREKEKVILSEKNVGNEVEVALKAEKLSTLQVGDILEGTVTVIASFGLFVNANGLEGLVHLSQISWDKVTNPSDFYKEGDKVKVAVLSINDNGKKIAFSIKKLLKDPWQDIVQKYKVGQTVEGKISDIATYGAFVKIEEGLNGLIHISELSSKLVKDPAKIVKVGQAVKVVIISISHEDRHLGLSLKRAAAKGEEKSSGETVSDSESSREIEGLNKLIEDNKG